MCVFDSYVLSLAGSENPDSWSTFSNPFITQNTTSAFQESDLTNDDEEEDEPEFEPLSLEDNDKDLQKVKSPLFVRELIDYLKKQDDREHIEVALQSAEALIKSSRSEINTIAAELQSLLISVGSITYLDDAKLSSLRSNANPFSQGILDSVES